VERLTRAAAFLDRDGTLNERPEPHRWVTEASEFRILPGTVEGLVRLSRCNLTLVVVSNQRGLTRGAVTEGLLCATEDTLQGELAPHGVRIESFYYCPHEVEADCDCRKPKPGLLMRAAEDLALDLSASWMIGDSETDVEAGRAAGCKTLLLGDHDGGSATAVADSLPAAAQLVCARQRATASNSATSAL
jgi:D-glycero-D-manno-heptose 1,7-bisphosphate phosphatase